MKVIQILTTYEALAFLMEQDLDIHTACIIAKNMQAISVPKRVIDEKKEKLLQELVQKYGEKDHDGLLVEQDGQVKIIDVPAYQEEVTAFLETELEDAVKFFKIKESALADIKITPGQALALLEILDEQEEGEK